MYTSLDVWKDGRVWIAMRRAAILLLLSCRCRHMVRERAKPDMMHYPLPVQAGTPKSVVEPFMAFIILHRTASFLRPWHHLWLQWIHERDQSGIASCEKVRYTAERGDWRCISLRISPLRGFFWKSKEMVHQSRTLHDRLNLWGTPNEWHAHMPFVSLDEQISYIFTVLMSCSRKRERCCCEVLWPDKFCVTFIGSSVPSFVSNGQGKKNDSSLPTMLALLLQTSWIPVFSRGFPHLIELIVNRFNSS